MATEPDSLASPQGKFGDTQAAEVPPVLRTGYAMPDVEAQMRELQPQLYEPTPPTGQPESYEHRRAALGLSHPHTPSHDFKFGPNTFRVQDDRQEHVIDPLLADYAHIDVLQSHTTAGLIKEEITKTTKSLYNSGLMSMTLSEINSIGRDCVLGGEQTLGQLIQQVAELGGYLPEQIKVFMVEMDAMAEALATRAVTTGNTLSDIVLDKATSSVHSSKQVLGRSKRLGSLVLTTGEPWTDKQLLERCSRIERTMLGMGWVLHADHGVWQLHDGALLNLDNAIRYQIIVSQTEPSNPLRAAYYQGRVDFTDVEWSLEAFGTTFGEYAPPRAWSEDNTECKRQYTTLLQCGWTDVTILNKFQFQGGPVISLAHAFALHELMLNSGTKVAEIVYAAYMDGVDVWDAEYQDKLPKSPEKQLQELQGLPKWVHELNEIKSLGWVECGEGAVEWRHPDHGDKRFTQDEVLRIIADHKSEQSHGGSHGEV